MSRDVVIIGAGHNGLVAASYLAKAGLKPLVLEQADRVGGCAMTTVLAPGFSCPTLAHRANLDPAIVTDLGLERHGLQILRTPALACAPTLDGRALTLWAEPRQAAREIAAFSERDAEQYAPFLDSVGSISRVLRSVLGAPPPLSDQSIHTDLLPLLKAGAAFRRLKKRDAYRLVRWLPMSAADLVGEWFESEPLSAIVAAGGILGSHHGPRSPGSAAVLLVLAAADGNPIVAGWPARGATGAVADALAMAARHAGAEIRTSAGVRTIVVANGEATGVVLESGEEIAAHHVISGVDPRRTFLQLVGPVHLGPEFVHHVQNIRMRGTLAKVNYALSSLPSFTGLQAMEVSRRTAALSGCVRLGPEMAALERAFDAAKYGAYSQAPWIELAIPSIADPALAPDGQHVASAYVQFAPYGLRESTWDQERDRLGDVTTRTIARYAPGFEASILARQVITPLDLERAYGLTGGQVFHGELALDQMLFARPLIGWARYRTPIRGLTLCGSGVHPGTGLDGRSGSVAAKEILNVIQATRKSSR